MKIQIAILMLITIVTTNIVSCKKESLKNSNEQQQSSLSTKEWDTCNCSASTSKDGLEEYIKADINGIPICFDQLPQLGDTFPNMLKYGYILDDTGSKYYDNLYMVRNASNSHWQLALYFENTHALTKSYPYQLPRANPEVCEIGELQLNDLDHYTNCTFCYENKYNYYARFLSGGVKMTATNFTNNVFEGIFDGSAQTGSGKIVTITNGKFRIKLKVVQFNI